MSVPHRPTNHHPERNTVDDPPESQRGRLPGHASDHLAFDEFQYFEKSEFSSTAPHAPYEEMNERRSTEQRQQGSENGREVDRLTEVDQRRRSER